MYVLYGIDNMLPLVASIIFDVFIDIVCINCCDSLGSKISIKPPSLTVMAELYLFVHNMIAINHTVIVTVYELILKLQIVFSVAAFNFNLFQVMHLVGL